MRRTLLLSLAALAIAGPAFAADYKVGGIEVRHPWTRPAPAGLNGVGYLTLVNKGSKPIRLVAAQSPAARSVTLHQSMTSGGVTRMQSVSQGIGLAPGASMTFGPGGHHLMLMGLTKTLSPDDKAPLTLVFEDGKKVQIDLSVETGAGAPPMPPMSGMDHGHD